MIEEPSSTLSIRTLSKTALPFLLLFLTNIEAVSSSSNLVTLAESKVYSIKPVLAWLNATFLPKYKDNPIVPKLAATFAVTGSNPKAWCANSPTGRNLVPLASTDC